VKLVTFGDHRSIPGQRTWKFTHRLASYTSPIPYLGLISCWPCTDRVAYPVLLWWEEVPGDLVLCPGLSWKQEKTFNFRTPSSLIAPRETAWALIGPVSNGKIGYLKDPRWGLPPRAFLWFPWPLTPPWPPRLPTIRTWQSQGQESKTDFSPL